MRLPLVDDAKGIGLQVRSVFEWFELYEVTASPIASLKGDRPDDGARVEIMTRFDGVTEHTTGIHECADPAATMLVIPPKSHENGAPQMIEIVLRSLRLRARLLTGARDDHPMKDVAA